MAKILIGKHKAELAYIKKLSDDYRVLNTGKFHKRFLLPMCNSNNEIKVVYIPDDILILQLFEKCGSVIYKSDVIKFMNENNYVFREKPINPEWEWKYVMTK